MIRIGRFLPGLFLALFASAACGQSERKLADWVKDLDSDHPLVREEAIEMIGTFGNENKEAIARVEKLLKDPKPSVRFRSAAALIKLGNKPAPLIPILVEAARKCGMSEKLLALEYAVEHGKLEDGGAALLPELLADRDARTRFQVERRLTNLNAKSAPVLLQLASSSDREIVLWMLRQIERLNLDASTLEPHLRPLLKDRPVVIRGLAAACLIRAKADIEPLLPVVKEVLAEKEYEGKRAVLFAIADSGVKPKALVPALEEALKDPTPIIRVRAAAMLWEIDGRTKDVIPALAACLPSRTESGARMYAEHTIQKMGDAAAEVVPAVVDVLRGEPPGFTISHYSFTLGRLGDKAIEPLKKYLDDGDKRIRDLAAASLGLIGESAVPDLVKEFDKATGSKRSAIINTFAQMRSRAEAAAPTLVEALGKADAEEQRAIVNALSAIGPCARPALPKILELLKDPKSAAPRSLLVQAIGAIGPWAGSAVPALVNVLKDEALNVNERFAVALALGNIGAPAKDAIPSLLDLSKKNPGTMRWQILRAALRIDPRNKDVHQAIGELCKDASQRQSVMAMMRDLVIYGEDLTPVLPAILASQKGQPTPANELIQLLGQLGAARPDVVAYLQASLDHADSPIHTQAALALARLGVFDEKSTDHLTQMVLNRADVLRSQVLQQIVNHGSKARALAPGLLKAWQQEDNPALRMSLAEALTLADASKARPLVDWLKEFSNRTEPYYAVKAAMALWRIDRSYDPLPVLRRALKTPMPNGQFAAAAMGELGAVGKAAIPDLQALLKSDDPMLKGTALIALLKIEPGSIESPKPAIEELLKNRNPRWISPRQNMVKFLGEMGKQAKPLLPALLEGIRRVDVYERAIYTTAIRRIDPEALKFPND